MPESCLPPAHSATLPSLEALARRYAALPRVDAETLIDAQVSTAIREWRVTDATFWQRVKFRSRMIRTAAPRSTAFAQDSTDR